MSTTLAARRRTDALRLGIVALVMLALAAVTLGIEARSSHPNLADGPMLPRLSERIAQAQKITIISRQASYRIERMPRGDQEVWVMRDRGDFPVRAAPLAALTEGLENLRMTRRMTSDAQRHERLGVVDPRQGGEGVLVQIEDSQGALLVNLILGVEPSGLYARRPDDDQTWAVQGDLPPLRDVSTWLELRPQTVSPERIARAEIIPREGRAYSLERRNQGAADFDIVAPARLEPLARSRLADAAERVARLSPIDVLPAPAVVGAPFARLRIATYDGIILDGELIASQGKAWVKLVARPENPEQEAAALAINQQVAAWAYGIGPEEVEALTPSLAALLPPSAAPEPAPVQAPARRAPPPPRSTAPAPSALPAASAEN